jgi:RNA polymerase sigma factor (sigma-70 family)
MQQAQLLEEELAHERVFEENYSWLMQWALRLTEGNHSEAEDLVHDLFIQLMRLRPGLDSDPDRVRGYLYTMLRNMHLSQLRRAQRSPICELSVVDYDSVEQGLRSIPHRPLSAIWMELLGICDYACERKKTSRSASVLILRFFLAYFPSEIARILKTTRIPVDKYLRPERGTPQRLATSRSTYLWAETHVSRIAAGARRVAGMLSGAAPSGLSIM